MPTRWGIGIWTDNGTDATITLGNGSAQDHYHSPYGVAAGDVISLSVDAKLGKATNVCLAWWGQVATVISFGAAQGLNTSTFTTTQTQFTAWSTADLE